MHLMFFLDLNIDNGSYVSVVGKYLLLLWKWFSWGDEQVNYF